MVRGLPRVEPLLPFDDVQVTHAPAIPARRSGAARRAATPPGDEHELPYDTNRKTPRLPPRVGEPMRVLVIDNYDSFVFNLVQYLGQLGADCDVRRNDEVTRRRGRRSSASTASCSRPAPAPRTAPASASTLVRACAGQAAGLRRLPRAPGDRRGLRRHGDPRPGAAARQDLARCTTTAPGVLAGLPDPFTATRYHSLAVRRATLPDELEVTGRTDSGVVMALRHRDAADRGRAVPPRVGADRGRPPDAGQLAGRLRRPGRAGPGAGAGRRGGGAPPSPRSPPPDRRPLSDRQYSSSSCRRARAVRSVTARTVTETTPTA